ncbi:outer membrane protein [Ferrigenium kumadai]|uniref:Outer membrane protein n=1 Tax=Ferrigenium kumadai TaxID=1682490 RepID=A0AAN1W0P7_9PROT|nr:TolC family outer membrane protein [Ferrigenium kumadai]BBJ00670.1 outer membrane protein [Ferrigenium kumadai]
MRLKPYLLATLLAAAGSAQAADLLETFHAAQANDPVFAAARAARQAGLEKLPQGRSLLLPNLNLGANSTLNDQTVQYRGAFPFPGGNQRYNSHGYNVNLTQPLFRQQNWLAYTESELQVAQAEAQFLLAEQDLILRVAQAYFDVLIAQDSVRLAEAQKTAIAEQLEQAKRNFEVGSATITDTHEAQARYDLTSAQEIAAQNDLEIKRRALQQLLNAMPKELKPLGKEFKLEAPQPADMEKWVGDAESNNPQLAIAKAAAEIADKEVARNRGGHYPTVDLVANYSKTYANGGTFGVGSDVTGKSVGVQLNVPLFQGGVVNSRWREAEANRDRAKEELENARRTVATQTRQAYLGVVSGIAQVKALQQALTSSESVLEASKLGQEVGVRTNLDVLNAQQQLYATRRDLYQAEYNYLVSHLRLKAAAGSLGEEDVDRVNRALH